MPTKLKQKNLSGSIFISFFRGLQLGLKNFWRNKFLSFATIMVMAVIIFIFNVILTINFIGNQSLQSLSERVDIVVYLADNSDFFEVKLLTDELQKISGVKTVKYTTKEEALEIVAKTHPKTAEFLKKFDLENPLPPSISIVTENPEDHAKIEEVLSRPEFATITQNFVTEGSSGESRILNSIAANLQNISKFVRQIIFWIVLVFILGGTLIIVNAIQLTIYSRQQEIHVMRLVGATAGFIRLPYIVEAIIYAVSAIILSFIIMYFVGMTVNFENMSLWTLYGSFDIWKIFIIELAFTILLATISSFSATEQYIKGKLQLG